MQRKTREEVVRAEGWRICGNQVGGHGAVTSVCPAVGRANDFNNAECCNTLDHNGGSSRWSRQSVLQKAMFV